MNAHRTQKKTACPLGRVIAVVVVVVGVGVVVALVVCC